MAPDIENLFCGGKPEIPVIKPEFKEGTRIILINPQHPYHNIKGWVLDRDHRYYRVKLDNTDIIWCPEHWIEPDKSII